MTDVLEVDGANDIVSGIPGSVAPFGSVGSGLQAVAWITSNPSATLVNHYYIEAGVRPFAGVALNPAPDWLAGILDRVRRLSSLPPGWDGHTGRPVSHSAITAALRFLVQLAPHVRVPPSMVPTVSGGVAVEWHRGTVDIEIEFPVSGPAMALQSGPGDIEVDGLLEAELPTVVRTLLSLA